MDKFKQEEELEKRHYSENDRIHTEFRWKVEFTDKLRELDEEFRKKFNEIFKKEEPPT